MLAKSLEMSKSTPLSLTVHFNLEAVIWDGYDGSLFHGIWNVILPHLDRCWSLTVTHWDAAGLQELLPLPRHLANLAYLQLEVYEASHLLGPIFEPDSISPLQEIVVHHHQTQILDRDEWEPEWRPEVPVSKLTCVTLSITAERLGAALIFLEKCPALTRLTLEIAGKAYPDPTTPPFILPHLQILSITDAIDFELSTYINAPNLHTLTVTVTESGWLYSRFMPGWEPSAPHIIYPLLRKLHISIGSNSFMPKLAGLQSFVQAHPSIEVLSIEGWTIMIGVLTSLLDDDDDRDIARMFPSIGHTRWLPNLQALLSSGGFTEPELEADPNDEKSPSTFVHALLMERPNLHISVGSEWQRTRHKFTSEAWPHDLASRFHLLS